MARLIPPYFAPENPSPGERLLFGNIKRDPASQGWVVLHSLGIARHPSRLAGEIDFVVIVPGMGILCLEIKAGQVSRHEGVWIYGSGASRRTSLVGPFRQAAEGMHALREHVSRVDRDLGKLLFWSGVFFTDIDFDRQSPEWHSWQYAGRSDLASRPVSTSCRKILERAHEELGRTPSAMWYGNSSSRPTDEQVKRLVRILRPDFECAVVPRALVHRAEKEIARFTEEQFAALDVLDYNPRILFLGPAGTGKTFLAVEASRRSAHNGTQTLLTCYNRLLGQWLESTTSRVQGPTCGRLTAGTFHGVLLRLSGLRVPGDASQEFWCETLPDAVIERVLSGAVSTPQFSFACLDEAQDLVTPKYLDVLDLLLEGGVAGGRWAMFGDFEKQAIYSTEGTGGDLGKQRLLLKARAPDHFTFPLRTNCRNTPQIAAGIEVASGLNPGYSRLLNTVDGPDIEVVFYSSPEEAVTSLAGTLESLRDRCGAGDVIVLSAREDSSATAARLAAERPELGLEALRETGGSARRTRYATIHGFKGLEATAVVLTDVSRLRGTDAEMLLYVGMSRARVQLSLQMSEDCRQDWIRLVQSGFARKGRGRKG